MKTAVCLCLCSGIFLIILHPPPFDVAWKPAGRQSTTKNKGVFKIKRAFKQFSFLRSVVSNRPQSWGHSVPTSARVFLFTWPASEYCALAAWRPGSVTVHHLDLIKKNYKKRTPMPYRTDVPLTMPTPMSLNE